MDWNKVVDKVKRTVDERGGPESVKEDAEELRQIAESDGTVREKLRRAAAAVKEPGAHRQTGGAEPGAEVPPR